ncbi:hypothetical protein X777_07180 [Ooceraea biroi]|uniref:Uncharacterized protein n=1 Tax=Ooceraea biroi TaxID=2015173 RepID=A0A026WA85_OOCBI|nr:hypothetical protein X777_07180 [Ooceraea biroi]
MLVYLIEIDIDFFENFVENRYEMIDVVNGEDHRRFQFQNVVIRTIAADEDLVLLHPRYNMATDFQGVLLKTFAFDHFHHRVRHCTRYRIATKSIRSRFLRKYHLPRTYRVEVFDSSIAEAARDLRRCNNSRNGMTIAHGLAHGDYVRNNVLAVHLEGPHVSADPSKTDLDFVRNADSSSFTYVSGR